MMTLFSFGILTFEIALLAIYMDDILLIENDTRVLTKKKD